jgi:hypothetical protein
MKTRLVGSFPLASGSRVSVVWWDIPMPTIPPLQATPKFVRGATMADLKAADGLHMLAFGDHADGSKVIYDCVARYQNSIPAGHAQAPA